MLKHFADKFVFQIWRNLLSFVAFNDLVFNLVVGLGGHILGDFGCLEDAIYFRVGGWLVAKGTGYMFAGLPGAVGLGVVF